MESTLLLIHGDREEDVQFRTVLKRTTPGLDLSIACNPDQVRVFPPPKLILLDLDLCEPSAFEMLKWLRSGQPYERIPVIVMSSSQETNHVNRALELGATSCLLKPADSDLDGVARGIGM